MHQLIVFIYLFRRWLLLLLVLLWLLFVLICVESSTFEQCTRSSRSTIVPNNQHLDNKSSIRNKCAFTCCVCNTCLSFVHVLFFLYIHFCHSFMRRFSVSLYRSFVLSIVHSHSVVFPLSLCSLICAFHFTPQRNSDPNTLSCSHARQ